jgi:hypothetical protein
MTKDGPQCGDQGIMVQKMGQNLGTLSCAKRLLSFNNCCPLAQHSERPLLLAPGRGLGALCLSLVGKRQTKSNTAEKSKRCVAASGDLPESFSSPPLTRYVHRSECNIIDLLPSLSILYLVHVDCLFRGCFPSIFGLRRSLPFISHRVFTAGRTSRPQTFSQYNQFRCYFWSAL